MYCPCACNRLICKVFLAAGLLMNSGYLRARESSIWLRLSPSPVQRPEPCRLGMNRPPPAGTLTACGMHWAFGANGTGHVAATVFLFTSPFVLNGFRLHIGLTVPRQDRVACALESCWSFAHPRTLIDRSCCPELPPVAVVVCHMPC